MTIMMFALWIFSIIGLLILIFTGFQYADLNIIVGIFIGFTLLNSFLDVHKRK